MSTAYAGLYQQQLTAETTVSADLADAASANAASAAAAAVVAESASGTPIGPSGYHQLNFHRNSNKQFRFRGIASNGSGGIGYHRNPAAGFIAKPPLLCEVCNARCTDDAMYQSHLNGAKHTKKVRELNFKEKSEAKDPSVYCEVCNLTLHPDLMLSHRDGKRHRKAAAGELDGGAAVDAKASTASHKPKSRSKVVKTERSAASAATTATVPPDGDQSATTAASTSTDPAAQPTVDSAMSAMEQLNNLSKEDLIKLINKRYRMECSVCRVAFTAFQLAETHFNSRAHRKAFQQYQSDQIRSKGYVCQVCDLPLNSKELMDAHVLGYKHALRENGNYIPVGHPFYGKYQKALENRMTYRRRDAV